MYGFLLTTYNDADRAIEAFESLKESVPVGESYKIAVVDGGSRPEEIDKINSGIGGIIDSHPDLSMALNLGIYALLGYNSDNIDEFVKTGDTDCQHIIWCHTDMSFHQKDWARKLIEVYEAYYPLFYKLSPATTCIDGGIQALQNGEAFGHSNNCPWVMNSEAIRSVIAKFGNVFNPKYVRIGGVEDHDLWFRILSLGSYVGVTNLVDVAHIGMGTRAKRDTNADQIHNREVFHSIWGGDIYPKIDFDLSEVNKEAMEKFSHFKDEVISLIPKRDEYFKILKENNAK